MLMDKFVLDKIDKMMICIMVWFFLIFGNICRGFLKKKLIIGK